MANYSKGVWLFIGMCYIPAFFVATYLNQYFFMLLSCFGGIYTLGQLFDRKEPLPKQEYEITDPNKKKTEVVRK